MNLSTNRKLLKAISDINIDSQFFSKGIMPLINYKEDPQDTETYTNLNNDIAKIVHELIDNLTMVKNTIGKTVV